MYRIRPGSRITRPLPHKVLPLSQYTSAFGLEEYLTCLLAQEDKQLEEICKPPESVDAQAWLYELVRRICVDLNWIITAMIPHCKCQYMQAAESEFLCAAHGEPVMCSAMSYAHHTLDQSISQLTNTTNFPSRLSVSRERSDVFNSIARRLHRIYSHAFYVHPDIFWKVEDERQVYEFFLAVANRFDLLNARDVTFDPTDRETSTNDEMTEDIEHVEFVMNVGENDDFDNDFEGDQTGEIVIMQDENLQQYINDSGSDVGEHSTPMVEQGDPFDEHRQRSPFTNNFQFSSTETDQDPSDTGLGVQEMSVQGVGLAERELNSADGFHTSFRPLPSVPATLKDDTDEDDEDDVTVHAA